LVITLTVVDRMEGLKGFQSLLARNRIATPAEKPDASAPPAEPANDKTPAGGESASDLVCVYVEAQSEQLADVLQQLRNEMQFRELRVGEPLALAALDQRAGNRILGRQPASDSRSSHEFGVELKGGLSKDKLSQGSGKKLSADDKSSKNTPAKTAKPASAPTVADFDGDESTARARKSVRDSVAYSEQFNNGIVAARQMQLNLPQSVLNESPGAPAIVDELVAGSRSSGFRSAVVARRPQLPFGVVKSEGEESGAAKQQVAPPVQVLFVLIDEKTGAPLTLPSTVPPPAPKKARDDSGTSKDDGAAS
jgi:hypothetical protein